MPLPTTKTEIKKDPISCKRLVYGPPKAGKTAFEAVYDKTLFIATEERHNQFEIYKQSVGSWEEFTETVKELQEKHSELPYKRVVVDTISILYDMCQTHICNENGIKYPGDLAHGKGWDLVKKEFSFWLLSLTRLDLGITFICHSKRVDIKTSIKEMSSVEIGLPDSARKIVLAMVDQILFIASDTYRRKTKDKNGEETVEEYDERTMICALTSDIEAGDSFGVLPPRFKMGDTAEEAWKRYTSYFKKGKK